MRWPEASRLIDHIRKERPELIVDTHASGTKDHVAVRVSTIQKDGRRLIPESLDTFYGPDGWKLPWKFVHAHQKRFEIGGLLADADAAKMFDGVDDGDSRTWTVVVCWTR